MENDSKDIAPISVYQYSSTLVLRMMRGMSYLPGLGLGCHQQGPYEFAFPIDHDTPYGLGYTPIEDDARLLTNQNAYTSLTAQLPKDYCLIPGSCTIKLVETQKSPIVNHFQFWFWPDILQVHRSTSNKMDISPDIDPTEISEF